MQFSIAALLLFMVYYASAAPMQQAEEDKESYFWCDGTPADIFILMDASTSIWPKEFKKQLQFIKNLVQSFPISPEETRVGIGSFSNDYRTEIAFDQYSNVTELTKGIQGIKQLYGDTYTNKALEAVRRKIFSNARPEAAHMLVVLTDGVSKYKLQTRFQAKALKESKVSIFAIGVGKGVNMAELKAIGNEPSTTFVHSVESFDALDKVKNTIRETLAYEICKVELPKYEPYCSAHMETDVMFLFDALSMGTKNAGHVRNFVGDVISNFGNMDDSTLQAGVMSGGCMEETNIHLNEFNNKNDLTSAISNVDVKGLDQMVFELHNKSYHKSRGGRDSARRIAVIVIDESTEKSDRLLLEINLAKKKGDVEIFVVAVGESEGLDVYDSAVSSPVDQHFFRVPSHERLGDIKDEYVDKFCNMI